MDKLESVRQVVAEHLRHISTETIGWLAVILIHCSTIPPILALLLGVSDHLPSIDVVAFMWAGLVLLFIKALLTKDTLNVVTIGVGFIIQAMLLGLLVFK
jgi:uncharacterized membrane protein